MRGIGSLRRVHKPSRALWIVFSLVLGWRVALLIFTGQPIPANDAFFFDGAVVNWLSGGGYFNPSIAGCFTISGTQVFSAYPPLYQGALLAWMWAFGTSVLSAMAFHLFLFTLSALLITLILRRVLPLVRFGWLALLFLCAITFTDRPDDLAHVFGLSSLLLTMICLGQTQVQWKPRLGLTLTLLAGLYTSPIGGSLYFGIALLTTGLAWLKGKRRLLWTPFIIAPLLAIVIAFGIAHFYPLAWEGFLENSAQTPVRAHGFRIPGPLEIVKIMRSAPVFFLFLACLPFWWMAHRKMLPPGSTSPDNRWIFLTIGIACGGWLLLLGAMVLFTANYVNYVLYGQVLLAAGVLAIVETCQPKWRAAFRLVTVGCLLLASIRPIGMTTWGAACASDIGRTKAASILREEMNSADLPAGRFVLSSAYLYQAWQLNHRDALHSDWIRDRRDQSPDADVQALIRLHPSRMFLTQFDYFRMYQSILIQLGKHSDLVTIRIRNTAKVPAPDSIPSLQRVVQHVAWAPVIVELDWK